ncbi:MAG TPA: GntR family transcriptional regulator [Mycobacterium sp.]
MPAAMSPTPLRRPRADQARQDADVLRHQIHAGAYDDGLAPDDELAGEFFVSRNTIREALAILKTEGLIDRGPKIGTHVAQRKYDHDLDALLGLKETFKNYGEVRNEVRAAVKIAAPPSVARPLLLEPAWQIREGAAKALSGAAGQVAIPALSRALDDPHLDVRKAAVLSLSRWAATEQAAQDALGTALDDRDADVRAYARRYGTG